MRNDKYILSRDNKIGVRFGKACALALISCALTMGVAHAQNNANANTGVTITPDVVASTSNSTQTPTLLGTVNRPPRPLPTILGMVESQREKLERLYLEFATKRIEQERKIADWQGDLQKAQSPASFDERNATRISKNLSAARQKIVDAFLKARGQALEVLSPGQRAQLQTLAQQETVSPVPAGAPAQPAQDEYYQLLLMPTEQLLGTPVDTQAFRRLAAQQEDRDRDISLGLGYGYGYGSSYGLFGGYGSGFGFGLGIGGGHRRRHRRR